MSVIGREPLPVTAGFTGQELTLASVAAQIAVLAEYEENLMSAIKRFVTVKNGSALVLTTSKGWQQRASTGRPRKPDVYRSSFSNAACSAR